MGMKGDLDGAYLRASSDHEYVYTREESAAEIFFSVFEYWVALSDRRQLEFDISSRALGWARQHVESANARCSMRWSR